MGSHNSSIATSHPPSLSFYNTFKWLASYVEAGAILLKEGGKSKKISIEKFAIRKSTNSWAQSAITNPQNFWSMQVCKFKIRIFLLINLQIKKSANRRLYWVRNSHICKLPHLRNVRNLVSTQICWFAICGTYLLTVHLSLTVKMYCKKNLGNVQYCQMVMYITTDEQKKSLICKERSLRQTVDTHTQSHPDC
jgi:hypothetical protein